MFWWAWLPRFTRLQILTDVALYLGGSFVEFPGSVGQGVRSGDDIMGLRMMLQLKAILNDGRRYFLKIWKGSITDHEVGHLVCEARQHIWSRTGRLLQSFLLTSPPSAVSKSHLAGKTSTQAKILRDNG